MKPGIIQKVALICLFFMTMGSNIFSKTVPPDIKEEMITYKSGDVTMAGFVAYDNNIKGPRPVVLVVPEWWGLNNYTKMRARKLAELGYFAIAVDLFGDGKNATNPKEAQELTGPFYQNPQLAKDRLDAAIEKAKEFPQANPNSISAIGYCFGGGMVLNSAKLGADFKAVVSFHGGLAGVPAVKGLLKAKILVCQGGSDKFVSKADGDEFKHKLDSIGATYTFKVYPNAMHAFTNPDATRLGKTFNLPIEYNAKADKDSWDDMKVFLASVLK
jgi:dienelactone hydrolase